MSLVDQGYAYVSSYMKARGTWAIKYLLAGTITLIESGEAQVEQTGDKGQVIAQERSVIDRTAKTVWYRSSHNAGKHGSDLLQALLPGRKFPYPKSLYAVEDCLRFVVGDRPDALIVDFFAGSGTTAHAVMRLNRQDGGERQSISVSNNEVSALEQKGLRETGLRPGDSDWEQRGICDLITKPRIEAAIDGLTPAGEPVAGDYKYTDEFPMAEGFEENAEFFTLTYESQVGVGHNRAFGRIAPLLWLRAGATGRRIEAIPDRGWDVANAYGVIVDLDEAAAFCEAVSAAADARMAYVVTDDDRRFQSVVRRLPEGVEPVRLYESYLSNFRFVSGE